MLIDTLSLKKNLYKLKINLYIILESNYIFIKENKKIIIHFFKKNNFQVIKIFIYKQEDWLNVFPELKKKNLFFKKRIFDITIYESKLLWTVKFNIEKIKKYLDENTIQILCFPYLSYTSLCKKFFIHYVKKKGIIINNSLSYIQNVKKWIDNKIKKNNINITEPAKNFLFKKNYKNIQFLINFLEQIILLYPQKTITLKMIHKYYDNTKIFNYYDWIKSIINFKKKKSIKILKFLKKQKYDYLILITVYKTLIYILLHLKEGTVIKKNYMNLSIYQNIIINMQLKKLTRKNTIDSITLALKLLKEIEICLKYEQINMIWMHLKTLSILLI